MRIIETNIPDIHKGNISESKIKLADDIINKLSPLFDEVHSSKIGKLESSRSDLISKKSAVVEDKKTLESLVSRYKRQKLTKKLLNKIQALVSSGLVYDSSTKAETIVLLKIMDTMTEDKLNQQINRVSNILTKRF